MSQQCSQDNLSGKLVKDLSLKARILGSILVGVKMLFFVFLGFFCLGTFRRKVVKVKQWFCTIYNNMYIMYNRSVKIITP
jgi:hypothetical protein